MSSSEPHKSLFLPRFRQTKGNYGYLHGKPMLMSSLSVSMAAWNFSMVDEIRSYKNTALQAHWHLCVLSAIPVTANCPIKHARSHKLMQTPPSAEITTRCREHTRYEWPVVTAAASCPPVCLFQHHHRDHRGPARWAAGSESHAKVHTSLLCPVAFPSSSEWTEKSIMQKMKMRKIETTAAFTVAKITQ